MAQWLSQFSGNTHLTKVKEREQQLRRAIDVWGKKKSHADRDAYMKTVVRFAEQLHVLNSASLRHASAVSTRLCG